jgi:hypothetical protein
MDNPIMTTKNIEISAEDGLRYATCLRKFIIDNGGSNFAKDHPLRMLEADLFAPTKGMLDDWAAEKEKELLKYGDVVDELESMLTDEAPSDAQRIVTRAITEIKKWRVHVGLLEHIEESLARNGLFSPNVSEH